MDWWEALYVQTFHQKKVLINEQQTGDTTPLFEIAKTLHSTWLQPYTVQRMAPQGSPRTPATCIAATTPELIVGFLISVFF